MAAISGKDGDVIVLGTQVCEVTKWSINETSTNPTYASNCSGGRKRRSGGQLDAVGSCDFKWDPGRPLYGTGAGQVKTGAAVRLALYIDDYQWIDVPAIISAFKLEVDIDAGAIIGGSFDWEESDAPTWHVGEESSNSSSSSSTSSTTNSSSSSL